MILELKELNQLMKSTNNEIRKKNMLLQTIDFLWRITPAISRTFKTGSGT